MAESLRVFLSHSSKDNDLTRKVRDALEARSNDELAIEVLVDLEDLEDGRTWPEQLHEMMADCHAAVLLLTENAVASDWMLKEATILSWRRSLESDFLLFVCQAESSDEASRKRGFPPLELERLQQIRSLGERDIAERVTTELRLANTRPGDTLFDRVRASAGDVLGELSTGKLERIARQLETPPPRWRPGRGDGEVQLEQVTVRLLRGSLGRYATLEALLNDLKASRLRDESLEKLLHWLACHWIDPLAGARLAAVTESETPRVTALNGEFVGDYTAERYVERAFPMAFSHRVFCPTPAAAGDHHRDYRKKIVDDVRERDARRRRPRYTGKSDAAVVQDLRGRDPKLFVVLGSDVDPDQLSLLVKDFPRIVFVLATGEQLDPEPHRHAVPLEPPVQLDVEARNYNDYYDAVGVIDRG